MHSYSEANCDTSRSDIANEYLMGVMQEHVGFSIIQRDSFANTYVAWKSDWFTSWCSRGPVDAAIHGRRMVPVLS